jgi:hypothetical protein
VYADNADNTDNGDNADHVSLHTISASTYFFKQNKMKPASHPPDSPDFAPSDFSLFDYIKGCLADFWFENVDKLLEIFQDILEGIEKVTLQAVFLELMNWVRNCITPNEESRDETKTKIVGE